MQREITTAGYADLQKQVEDAARLAARYLVPVYGDEDPAPAETRAYHIAMREAVAPLVAHVRAQAEELRSLIPFEPGSDEHSAALYGIGTAIIDTYRAAWAIPLYHGEPSVLSGEEGAG